MYMAAKSFSMENAKKSYTKITNVIQLQSLSRMKQQKKAINPDQDWISQFPHKNPGRKILEKGA